MLFVQLGLTLCVGAALLWLGLAGDTLWVAVAGPVGAALGAAALLRRPLRRRRALAGKMKPEWRRVLLDRIEFYRRLDDGGRARFEHNLRTILADYDFEGVGMEIDDELRILAASGATALLQGRDWDFPAIRPVLFYPDHFSDDYKVAASGEIAGMVQRQGAIVFSAKALRQGWRREHDGRNVAIHEFAHVLDLEDGVADGVPAMMSGGAVEPWASLVQEEMGRIKRHTSALRSYGATNEAEFFAVATEVFFERPDTLERQHPELFDDLEHLFRFDPGDQREGEGPRATSRSERNRKKRERRARRDRD